MNVFPLVFLCLVLPLAAVPQDAASVAEDLKALSEGRPVKVVWVQDAGPTACPYSEKPTMVLMGFDTEDGLGERTILAEPSRYIKPLLTDDGTRVVYGDAEKGGVFIVDFTGGTPRKILGDVEFMDVWEDPRDHVEWVYVREKVARGDRQALAIMRHRLDDPTVSELVWDKTGCHHFMLNGDGRAASGGGDGGNSPQGVFFLPNSHFAQRAGGCWPAMCPDDSLRSWVFTGNHRSIHFCFTTDRSGKGGSWGVRFDKSPGLELKGNEEMYHPRWSNHPRFLVLSSPFSRWSWSAEEGKIPNEVAAGVEVYFGKFTGDFRDIERWVKVSRNERGDYWPDAWVQPDGPPAWLAKEPDPLPEIEEPPEGVRPDRTGTVYAWTDGTTDNQLVDPGSGAVTQCGGRFLRSACLAQGFLLDLDDGAFVPDGAAGRWLEAAHAADAASFELVLAPSVASLAHPGAILDFGENLRLVQLGDRLRLSLRGHADPIELPVALSAGRPVHLAVSVSGAEGLRVAADGKRVLLPAGLERDAEGGSGAASSALSPRSWQPAPLTLGDVADGGANWPGRLESIAFLGRTLSLPDARLRVAAWRERAAAREPAAQRLEVEALLVGDCEPADPLGIAPYRRCLSVRHYRILKVHKGRTDDRDINVAQWSVLDGEVFAPYLDYKPGNSYRLSLEPWEAHPEQESERMTMGDEVDIEMPFYYQPPAIALPAAPAPDSAMPLWQLVRGGRNPRYGAVLAAPLRIRGEREPKPFSPDIAGGLHTAGQPVAIDSLSFQFAIDRALCLGGSGAVAGVAVVRGGTGVPSRPELVFEGGAGEGARAEAILGVESLEIVRLGSGFAEPPRVEFDPPDLYGGTPPAAQAFIDEASGALSRLVLHSSGSGYTFVPRVRLVGTGTGAEVKARMGIVGVHVLEGGRGYASMPRVTVEGVPDAILQPVSQETLLRYRGAQGNALVENTENGEVDQDGASILFDWAADGNNVGSRAIRNRGIWRMRDGAIIGFMSSTGRGLWIPHFITSGTFSLGKGCHLALQRFRNSGEAVFEAPSQIGHAAAWGSEDELANVGTLSVTGSDSTRPVRFGWTHPNGCGKRRLVNGDGTSAASFTITPGGAFRLVGSQATVENAAGSVFSVQSDAALEVATCDNGSGHPFNNREAKVSNQGEFILGGRLSVQGNHGGFTGIDNFGDLRLTDGAVLERLPNSAGEGSFYKADATSSRIENRPGATARVSGAFAYRNSTGNAEGRRLLFRNAGRLEVEGGAAMTDVDLVLANAGEGKESVLRATLGTDADAALLQLAGTTEGTGVLSIDDEAATVLEIVVPEGMAPHGAFRVVEAAAIRGTFASVRVAGSDAACDIRVADAALDVVFP
jgi:hypothetical protein